jgi:uncharacterized phage protein (TIGR01671 family)
MREILFRGKDESGILNHQWQYGALDNTDEKFPKIIRLDSWGNKMIVNVVPETVGQFTGLTDTNGKRIFEGDIVKCRHHWQLRVYPRAGIDEEQYFFSQKIRGAYGKGVDKGNVFIPCERYYYFRNYAVEYFARNGEFRVRNGSCFHPLTRSWIFNRDMEVIGNIHDNPELLEVR